ncbi:MAG: PIN domain-containing protein [Bacteroidota bacterium]
MILVDTSVWISFLRKDDEDLVYILKRYLKKNDVYTVSAVFGELFQGVKNNREKSMLEVIWKSLPKPEEKDLFVQAGRLSNEHKLYAKGVGLIDCYLMAACFANDLSLWTLDKKLQDAFELLNE